MPAASAPHAKDGVDDPAPAARRGEAEADRRQRRAQPVGESSSEGRPSAAFVRTGPDAVGLRSPPGAGATTAGVAREGLIQVIQSYCHGADGRNARPSSRLGPYAARRTDHQPLPLRRRCCRQAAQAGLPSVQDSRATRPHRTTRASGDEEVRQGVIHYTLPTIEDVAGGRNARE